MTFSINFFHREGLLANRALLLVHLILLYLRFIFHSFHTFFYTYLLLILQCFIKVLGFDYCNI